jgi:hypothetical protein
MCHHVRSRQPPNATSSDGLCDAFIRLLLGLERVGTPNQQSGKRVSSWSPVPLLLEGTKPVQGSLHPLKFALRDHALTVMSGKLGDMNE